MNITILYYIEKIETYLHEYIFKIYVYIKFVSYLMSNYYLKLQDYIYVWNSIKFVNQNWFSYNSKIYSHNNTPNINY
jgi:hypothetical protein